jgi:large subunit ribosomal protein L24
MGRMQKKFSIKRGDTVLVRRGEGRGKTGKVKEIHPATGRAVVEGLNLSKRHLRKSQKNTQGGIVELEAPIAIGRLCRFDPERAKARK